jgi:hypothetical protein
MGRTSPPSRQNRVAIGKRREQCLPCTCLGDDRCASWSYVQPAQQGQQGRCWLKTIVARPVDNANVISGVKFKPPESTF